MSGQTIDDDGFMTISDREPRGSNLVRFYRSSARIPFTVPPDHRFRADWQWDGNEMIRLRLGESGRYVTNRSGRTINITTTALYTAIGRDLHGARCPIDRVDGNDIYIAIGHVGVPDVELAS